MTTHTFIQKAKSIHGDRYDYSKVIYKNASTKVVIICPIHGEFEQRPNNHTSQKQGCKQCDDIRKRKRAQSMALTLEEFITKATKVHGDVYDYSMTQYLASNKPVYIQCLKHGIFSVARAEKHLLGQGCPTCRMFGSVGERIIVDILNTHGSHYQREVKFDDCRSPITNRRLSFDFYLPDKQILIEFDGVQHFKPCVLFKNMSVSKYTLHDQLKTKFAHENNLTLLRFEEKDIPNLRELLMQVLC